METKNKQKDEVNMHLKDILSECKSNKVDIAQIEHNVFEIANHLGIDTGEFK